MKEQFLVGGYSMQILTYKVLISKELTYILDKLYIQCRIAVDEMLEDRTKSSSKYYKTIPCVVAKSLISKYQRNRKCKSVKNLVIPICGDKGKQVKIVDGGLRVPAIFKKEVISITFPKPIVGFIRQVEFFKRGKKWYMSYNYNTSVQNTKITSVIGIDRNAVENVATLADAKTGKVLRLGPDVAGITKNFRNRRAKLQSKNKKCVLIKIKHKQSRRVKAINHNVSRAIVDYAKSHCSAIVMENLGTISKKGKAKRYVQKSQWPFFQLETFIKYKAALLGIPVYYVPPEYTSQRCSRCGSLNKPSSKKYKCSSCGHVDHRDANAAFNICMSMLPTGQAVTDRGVAVGHIGVPLNWRYEKAYQPESSGGI